MTVYERLGIVIGFADVVIALLRALSKYTFIPYTVYNDVGELFVVAPLPFNVIVNSRGSQIVLTVATPAEPTFVNVAVVSVPPVLLYPVEQVTAQLTVLLLTVGVALATPVPILHDACVHWAYNVAAAVNVVLAGKAPVLVIRCVPPLVAV